ncbi:hypothetical protein AQI88_33125 [Streptomyces cellostaticus]|uniref:Uncharacterized protein n=1 Tax=Streptomyces cellostaticus TaxID=67285 RepID=A0A117PUG5_9ACTN|nr:hypothetical protein [Streptomyces cellostaticus]KUM92242.1 hypothetical protein AQI88_33125 [Streptomyces cellostaticus]GHI05902.1 hypothetical protein Scel_42230 [Streptomyces cellostaticus]
MAFGAEELRVLRRALALALHPGRASAEDIKDCFRLAESLDEAMREGARLRAFLVADLGRYRAALPGTAADYLALLEEALGAGHRPTPDDLAALRALRGNPMAAALLDRCQVLAEQDVRARFAQGARKVPAPAVPPSRTRLLALPGGADSAPAVQPQGPEKPAQKPSQDPTGKPAPKPVRPPSEPPATQPSAPKRPIPTPGEVFPPRRRPGPPANPPETQQLAAG